MNSSMFLPQVAEQDIYNASGQQEDDINTVIEYIDQVVLGHHDNTPEDEDDDNGQNFHLTKDVNYCFQPFLIAIRSRPVILRRNKSYPPFQIGKLSVIYTEIISPPPECC